MLSHAMSCIQWAGIILATALMAATSIATAPQGKLPAIDGTISPGEWDSAAVSRFSDGSELMLMHTQGYLYLGIRAATPEMIVGNVFIDRGDEIAILHSSGALGTALYQKREDGWQQTQAFAWRCRRYDDGPEARAERDAFFNKERWVAANSRMGAPNELEFKIEMPDADLRLAVNFIRESDPNVKIPWPVDLGDDCIKPTPGGLPSRLDFSPESWGSLRNFLSSF